MAQPSGQPDPANQAAALRHRRAALYWFAAALAMVALALAALLYTFAIEGASQWPAIAWQVCQLLALVCFGTALWQKKKHRDLTHGFGDERG